MKNILVYLGVVVLIAATAIGQFTSIPNADFIQLAGYAVGLALAVIGTVKKAEKKDWKLYVSIIGVIVGAMLLVFAGVSEEKITSIMTLVAGLVVLVISLLPTVIKKKEIVKKE
jgi:hypothetical protein